MSFYRSVHWLHWALTLGAWLIAVAWIGKLIEAVRGLATVPNLLEEKYDVAPAGNPAVTVIVPARNEATNIAACLESLLDQDYANLRIVGVDDRSTDETGQIVSELVRTHTDRFEFLKITELPEGWLGKTHAMAVAAETAMAGSEPEYLLFTDADIVFRRDAVRRAVAEASASGADHFVLMPTTLVKTRGEGMLLAYLQVMGLWAVRPWQVADPRAMTDAIGVGAFNLIRTTVYRRLGGFEAARMEILEDLDLGRRVKLAGFRQRVATGPGMVSVHWAAGAAGIVNGMTKNLFAVFRFQPLLLVGAAAWIALFCIGPVAILPFAELWPAGVCALGSVAGLYMLSGRTSQISWLYGLSFPIAAAAVVYSMFRSMVITLVRGGVTWRGTFYPLDRLRRSAGRRV